MPTWIRRRWDGAAPPYIRLRCEGVCQEGPHHHMQWAGLVAHLLLAGIITLVLVALLLS